MTKYVLTLCNEETCEILAEEHYDSDDEPNSFIVRITLDPGNIE